jgi:antitoxin component YwqK of YwqJK toxin-antitoxin module
MNQFPIFSIAIACIFQSFSMYAQKTSEPCGNPGYIMEGNFINTSGVAPIMQTGSEVNTLTKVGDKGEISKHFEESLFGGNVTGWMLIGTVEITNIDFVKRQISFKVLEKKSEVIVNGKTQNHFTEGKYVKFAQLGFKTPTERKLYYVTGELKSIGKVSCGKEIGEWKYYYENGKTLKEGIYNDEGLENGYWIFNNQLGRPIKEGNYVNGKQDGTWKLYDEQGVLKKMQTYQMGKVIGPYQEYYSNGQVKIDGALLNDEENGYFKYYDEKGMLTSEGNYSITLKDGVWLDYDQSGARHSSMTYVKGKLNGAYQYYFADGKVSWEGYYNAAEQKEGEEKHYYDSGQQKSLYTIIRNYKSGPFKTWHSNGQISEIGEYTPGEMYQGYYQSFYEDGKPKSKGSYDFGNRTGKWELWDEKGKKKTKKF